MSNTTRGLCKECGRETDWSIGHQSDTDLYVDVHIVHVFVCEGCGLRVRECDWQMYQRIMRGKLEDEERN